MSTRFCSSGIDQSLERRPDSTCATGTPSFDAASEHASVALTSPLTTTRSGRSSRSTRSKAISVNPVCSAWEPEPIPRKRSGFGKARSSRISADMRSS